jgi:hypothetical protein
VLRLALGGLTPRRAGGTVEGGEVFDVGGEVGHGFKILALPDTIVAGIEGNYPV